MSGFTVESNIHFKNGGTSRKKLYRGKAPIPKPVERGRIPRVSYLMALAIRFDELLHDGHVTSYTDLARLAHVSKPRISQIMALLNLAPDILSLIHI